MKIAVASDDGTGLAQHFGRSRYFLVFNVSDGQITGPEARPNGCTASAQGECGHEPHDHHDHHAHSHDALVTALRDCQVVLAGGMGRRAAMDLEAHGIKPLAVSFSGPALEAVRAYLSGAIQPLGAWCCGHQ
ncbi:MAG: NifB/NifX family molybdenum-iron cluster-binding protein [Desulfobaccales bacterium]